MPLFNESLITYALVTNFTNDVTGSVTLTYGIIFLFLIIIGLIFKLEFDIMIILLTPFLLVLLAFTGELVPLIILLLFYLAFIFARGVLGLFSR